MRKVCRVALAPFFQITAEGVENVPLTGAFLLLPKHQRWEDIPLLGLACPRPLYYIAKYELFRNPVIGLFLQSLGGVPLNRRQPLKSRRQLRSVFSYLDHGEGIVVFPEGTYFRNQVGPGRPGVVRMILSRRTIPVIPVGIRYEVEKGFRRRAGIRFGEPMSREAGDPFEVWLNGVMKRIARLSGLENGMGAG